MSQVVVIGLGTAGRGDDEAGLHVARALAGRVPDGVVVVEQRGEATALLDALAGAGAAVLIDATASGAPAGTIHRLDATAAALPAAHQRASTHGFGVAEAIELARALGRLPARVIVLGIEGQEFGLGRPLSAAVAAAVAAACERALAEVAALTGDGESCTSCP